MKPRDLLKVYLIKNVAASVEPLGFKYSASQLSFSRVQQGNRQVFHFVLSMWNSEDNCIFWTVWSVTSKFYADWHKNEWGELPVNNALGGDSDWNIPGWKGGEGHHFHLQNTKADSGEIERLTRNVFLVGIPFLDQVSTWEGAADYLLEHKSMYHRAADFLVIAGQVERAKEVLAEGVRQYEELGRIDNSDDLLKIRARLIRYR